jgi:hypothetical protein
MTFEAERKGFNYAQREEALELSVVVSGIQL